MLNTQCGPRGGYLVNEPAKPKRMAWFSVSWGLLERMLDADIMNCLRAGAGMCPKDVPEWEPFVARIHKGLRLPTNYEIDAVSPHWRFAQDQVAFRVECPDFLEAPEAATMVETEPMYSVTEDLLGRRVVHFADWSGGTVPGYKKPDPPRTDRCSEELGHFAPSGSLLCYCGQVAQNYETWTWAKIEPVYRFDAKPIYFGALAYVDEPKKKLHLLTTEESEKLEQPKRSNRGYEFL